MLVTIEFSPSGLVSSEVHVTTLQPRIFLTPEGLGSIGEWMTTFGETSRVRIENHDHGRRSNRCHVHALLCCRGSLRACQGPVEILQVNVEKLSSPPWRFLARELFNLSKSCTVVPRNPWNTIDWIVLVFLITAFAIRLKIYSATPATRITYTTGSATTSVMLESIQLSLQNYS